MADPSGRGGYGNQPPQGYYGNQQPQQYYNMGMQQDMRQPQQPMQHQGMGGQGMSGMPQMSLQGMLQQPPMTPQQLQQNQMQHQGYSQGPTAMSQQQMQPPPQMANRGYPQGPPMGQPQMQQPPMGNQGYSQGPPMVQQQMQGSQMGQQQMQQPPMMSQQMQQPPMQHGMSQPMQEQTGMNHQNYKQPPPMQQPQMAQQPMMQPAPQIQQQQPMQQQPMQHSYGQQHQQHMEMPPQQHHPQMQQTMQQPPQQIPQSVQQQIPQSMQQPSMSMAGYPETQVNRPLAAVQQMDPVRPLTPTMSTGSPSSVPMMRSASPMVPYPTPQSTGSPLVTNAVQRSASPMPAQQPQQQPRRAAPPSAVTTAAPTTGTSTSTSSRTGGSSSQPQSSSSSAQRSSGTRHSSSGNMQLNLFIKTGIYLIRHLRTEMLKRTDALEMEPEDLAANAKEVERIYMELEKLAQQNVVMPETPAKGKAFIDTAVMSENGMNSLNKAISCFLIEERNETAAQHHYEILRHELSNIRPITSVFRKAEVPKHNLQETHEQFENAVRNMIRDRDTQKAHNYRITLHPAGLMCSLLEVELAKRKDPVYVAQIKATIFVQYGQLVIVRFGSPFENLISDEEAIGDSKHIVFQKMSQFATEKLSGSSTSACLNSANRINAVIMFLQLFTLCFSSTCCKCKNIMNELLPPTRIADVNMSKPLFQHEACE